MTLSSNEMPYVVTSEISISSNSISNEIFERNIDVNVRSLLDNSSECSNTSLHYQENDLTENQSQYVSNSLYMTDSLQKSQWPQLRISSSYIRQSPRYTESKTTQDDKNATNEQKNKITLTSSPAQSLEKLSKEDKQKIANQSPRTRQLKPPFFDPSATPHKNFIIPDSHYREIETTKKAKTSFNNYYYDHLNSDFNSQIKNSSLSNSSFRKTQTKSSISKSKLDSSSIQSMSNQKASDLFSQNNSSNLTQKPQKIGVIYRKSRPKTMNYDDRPYFTTSQAPLTKRPCMYCEMGSSTISHIL